VCLLPASLLPTYPSQAVALALGPCKQPLPAFRHTHNCCVCAVRVLCLCLPTCLLLSSHCLQAVALALGPCKQPLPAFRHAAYPFDGQYGQIGHNTELIKGFGPVSSWILWVWGWGFLRQGLT
jgi:hypothetical protein